MISYGDISPKVAAYSVKNMLKNSSLSLDVFRKRRPSGPPPHLLVPCSVCEAAAGEPCRAVRRHFNWIGGKHAERMDDARCVAEALEALNPAPGLKSGDTVTFASREWQIV